jgi:hypothetical protein
MVEITSLAIILGYCSLFISIMVLMGFAGINIIMKTFSFMEDKGSFIKSVSLGISITAIIIAIHLFGALDGYSLPVQGTRGIYWHEIVIILTMLLIMTIPPIALWIEEVA